MPLMTKDAHKAVFAGKEIGVITLFKVSVAQKISNSVSSVF